MQNHVTMMRIELKYVLPAEAAERILSRLPRMESVTYRVSSVYLDCPDHRLARAALEDPRRCTKIRAREYVDTSDSVWVEMKARCGVWNEKTRFPIPKRSIDALLQGVLRESDLDLSATPPEEEPDLRRSFRRFREFTNDRLVPVGVVSASRRAFFRSTDSCRVSIDTDITYFAPPDGVYRATGSLDPSQMGPPLYREPSCVLEIKFRGRLQPWCRDLVEGLDATEYSKFRVLVHCSEAALRP